MEFLLFLTICWLTFLAFGIWERPAPVPERPYEKYAPRYEIPYEDLEGKG